MRKGLGRPSPAMVVASIALFVALGGTGYAAATGSIDSREIKNSSIKGTDVKDKSLTTKDFKGSVRGPAGRNGVNGAPGLTGATGATGAKGSPGAPGTARAYAFVAADGTVDATKSKGITQANIDTETVPVTGAICLTGLSFTPRSVMALAATPGAGQEDTIATADVAPGGTIGVGDCSGSVLIRTFEVGIGVFNAPFHVWLQD